MPLRPTGEHDTMRGATLVEYALIVAVVAMVTMTSIEAMRGHVGAILGALTRDIETSSYRRTPAGTTSVPPVATTAPPSTAAPTTIAPTTTTTTPATSGSADLANPTATSNGYTWTATSSVSLRDENGRPIADAVVTVTIRHQVRSWFGTSWQETQVEVTTGGDGTAAIQAGPYWRLTTAEVEIQVTGATLPGGLTWDGQASSATAHAP
jgi:Flp pilus assembly pilin Flp